MDPDMVWQQQEAEREALALLHKRPAAPVHAGPGMEGVPTPLTPVFFGAELASAMIEEGIAAFSETAAAFSGVQEVQSEPAPQPPAEEEPALMRVGRFFFFGLGGAMVGGGAGVAATSYLQLPMKMAEMYIFGPASVMAVCSAFASLFVGGPKAGHEPRMSASGASGA